MDSQLQRILDLVRRTGDRMVVTDPNGEDAYVVMDLDSYEDMVDFHEAFLGDSEEEVPIDHEMLDIEASDEEVPDIWDVMQPASEESGETWNYEAMGEQEQKDLEQQFAEYQANKTVKPQNFAEVSGNRDSETPVEDDDDFGEEQFYLEPIE